MSSGVALRIVKLTVRPDRIVAQVVVANPWRYTTPNLVQGAVCERPHLLAHACVNERGSTFAAVANHTPLPHLFEHMVVDILVHHAPSDAREHVFVGTSEWTNKDAGEARVEVSYIDDLEALAAFKEAEECLNRLCAEAV